MGRNLFGELGKSPSEIDEKLNTAWAKLFLGDANNERVFYEADTDGGYILEGHTRCSLLDRSRNGEPCVLSDNG